MESEGRETEVRAMLAACGLSPTAAEIATICAGYAAFRAAVDALYGVPEARYADPALRFRAAGTKHTDWGHQ
jgi:hypothetical protein